MFKKKMVSLLLIFSLLVSFLPITGGKVLAESYDILPLTDEEGNTTFTYKGDESTENVYLVGQMNDWKTEDENMKLKRGEENNFTLTLDKTQLPGGDYEYKYIVDGAWVPDNEPNLSYIVPGKEPIDPSMKTNIIIHFDNPRDEDWSLWLWPKGGDGSEYTFNEKDAFGDVAKISIEGIHSEVGFLIKDKDWNKDIEEDRYIEINGSETEIWLKSGDSNIYYENPDEGPSLYDEINLKVHYHRYNPEELVGWKIYSWTNNEEEANSKVIDLKEEKEGLLLGEISIKGKDISHINIKISNGEIEEEIVKISKFDKDGNAEVWLSQGDSSIYKSEKEATMPIKISKASINDLHSIFVEFNRLIDSDILKYPKRVRSDDEIYKITDVKYSGKAINSAIFTIEEELDIEKKYEIFIEIDSKGTAISAPLGIGNFVGHPSFDEIYAYDGDLGPIYSKSSTEFKVWAPTAKEVNLLIFKGEEIKETIPMKRGDKGVYSYTLDGDQDGTVYMYEVYVDGKINKTVDPYAKSVTINGERSVVVNPKISQIDRPKKDKISRPIIWELHVRDLSNYVDSGIEHKGQFLGLTEEGTKTSSGQITGLDYIKSLGVTHVQLLPIYDFGSASVDERNPMDKFNWGYDPVNYNAPEGAYSTNPKDPYLRINELQEAIDTLHKNDLGVIMDVVYNHVFSVSEHAFDKIVPGYYFRYDDEGKLYNGTGVGNETASERAMVRKFMVDSLKYWTETYKLDGFRFDLMGIHDVETMNEIYKELVKINPNIFILGEGWSMGNHTRGAIPSDQVHGNEIDNIAMFNDHLRDKVKGSVFDDKDPGFINGKEGYEEELLDSIKTKRDLAGKNYDNPRQIIQYVEAHDNLTLWDKLLMTNVNNEDNETLLKRHKIGTAIPLLSQGIPFIHAGQEFARTKDGNSNSYNASAELNQLDWKRAEELSSNVNYVRELIKIRKSEDLFWMDSFEEIDKNFEKLIAKDKLIAYRLFDENTNIYIGHNVNEEKEVISGIENGKYLVLVRDQKANVKGLEEIEVRDGKIEIEGLSSLVIKKIKDEEKPLVIEVKDINSKKEEGYVRVIFDPTNKGKIDKLKKGSVLAYDVKEGLTWKEGKDKGLIIPEVTPVSKKYKFIGWDFNPKEDELIKDITIKGVFEIEKINNINDNKKPKDKNKAPKTGDISILPLILIAVISITSIYLIERKKNKELK